MKLNKTIQSFEDGTEFKISHLAVSCGIAMAVTGVYVALVEVKERRAARRWKKFWEDKGVNPEIN